jgi:methionyl-tRNA formyltransferase
MLTNPTHEESKKEEFLAQLASDRMKIVIAAPFSRYDVLESKLRSEYALMRVRTEQELQFEILQLFAPRYIFFPHWSLKIPSEIYENFECVIFHMTDLPYGRGGSPLQNLIVRGFQETVISAVRCVDAFDAGPVYHKRPLSLCGTAEEIFMRASRVIEEMIEIILRKQPQPDPQVGEPVIFHRRNREDGNLSGIDSLEKVYDYIRMLDADGYPKAYIETSGLVFEFTRASLRPNELIADVRITKK